MSDGQIVYEEWYVLANAMKIAQGQHTKAARIAQMERNTFRRRLTRYGMDIDHHTKVAPDQLYIRGIWPCARCYALRTPFARENWPCCCGYDVSKETHGSMCDPNPNAFYSRKSL